jgi:drug/metabolite transporter (DMT)-like permease
MHWIAATLVSAFLLGCYEVLTKHAVRDNAVLPILFLSNLCSAAIWLALIATQRLDPGALAPALTVAPLSLHQHGLLLVKSIIVASAWTCTYFAVKHLPVTISSPIRATGPVWTLIGGLAILAERPSFIQILGIGTALASFVGLSSAGRNEGIVFLRSRWIGWLMAGTLCNGISALYDKFLLGSAGFNAATVQAWFSIYLALLFLPLAAGWQFRWWPRNDFHWRWSIPLLSLSLLAADFVYFDALRNPEALVSIVASLRRASMLVGFAGGLLFFGESNSRRKMAAVAGVLLGVVLTVIG